MAKKIFGLLLILVIGIPITMWVSWLVTPKKKLVIALVDKTVLTSEGQEHISLGWILNQNRYTKTTDKPYKISEDYFGFFPLKDEAFQLKGLERFTHDQLRKLSADADMAYFTDTYGIYNNEWYKKGDIGAQSGMLYGGLSNEDLILLKAMKERNKLIITEFNTIGSPTRSQNRKKFEELFQLKWTGWTGRYFDTLDPNKNLEIPHWLIANYKRSHSGAWPFTRAGLVFVNDSDQVVILEEGLHIDNALPYIHATPEGQSNWNLPEKTKYPFWFDVMVPNLEVNTVDASFKLSLLPEGKKELAKYNIPETFPAVTRHLGEDYRFFYFSGDFSDNPIRLNSSYFKGIGFFKGFFYDDRDPLERGSFFWKFYKPMVTQILKTEMQLINQD
ncbi:hypothetical protein KCTC52924_02788 [Arenibacter antarcticus]|uniref:DKNYY family protein n=1 Tax=Arenibacter antarcticus TaxID=2040469 RepID=A0ABW5VG74_9FLAO|nr:hypothetical protein [Arenibacter sp. H213]MCM4167208.1 hypothetical protein [Arenibacter sp. H213]